MASSFATHLSLSLLLITILSSHARDNQFFNKQQPDFIPETGTGHGLYGQPDSAKLPSPATAEPKHRYLPKNYNPVSYVTEPEETADTTNLASNNNNDLFDGEPNYRLTPEEKAAEYRNSHYNGAAAAAGFEQQGMGDDARSLEKGKTNLASSNPDDNNNLYDGEQNYHLTPEEKGAEYRNNGAGAGSKGFGPQGMSDTRSLEKGKYYYDINSDKYSSNHPYEVMKNSYDGSDKNTYSGDGRRNSYYGNAYEFNGGKNAYDGVRRNSYYGNGDQNGYQFNGGRNFVAGYESRDDQGINENDRP